MSITAEREVQYLSYRLAAELAGENGKFADASGQYEAAWKIVPARAVNAMDAASASLLADDTARAVVLLARLRAGGDSDFSALATAMLKELATVEPSANEAGDGSKEFFRDAGPGQPVRIADLIPPVDRASLNTYGQALPKLADDPEPVVLLASLAAGPTAVTNAPMPPLSQPAITGDHPWAEVKASSVSASQGSATNADRPVSTADLASGARIHRVVLLTSEPAGAHVFAGEGTYPVCETPCNLQVADGTHSLRVSLAGYEEQRQKVVVKGADREVAIAMHPIQGSVIVETAAPVPITVNGTPVGAQSPAELALAPGLYRIGAQFGAEVRDRILMVKPGARLRLEIRQ